MAAPKKQASKAKAKKAANKPPKKSANKARAKAKAKPAKAKPAKAKPAKLSPVEGEVARLLADYDACRIDNAWDVLPRMMELNNLLPRSSTLWKAFKKMLRDIGEIARKSAMGED
jgi:hypothetical protein